MNESKDNTKPTTCSRCGTQEIVDELKKVVDRHRKAAYFTCAETCWCWDVERVILRLEKEFLQKEELTK